MVTKVNDCKWTVDAACEIEVTDKGIEIGRQLILWSEIDAARLLATSRAFFGSEQPKTLLGFPVVEKDLSKELGEPGEIRFGPKDTV